MALIKTITNSTQLYHDLQATSNYKDNFSYEGATALQAYLEELSDNIGDIDYDPVAFCCEYSEYEDLEDFHKSGGYDSENYPTWDKVEEYTVVIEFDGGFIVGDF